MNCTHEILTDEETNGHIKFDLTQTIYFKLKFYFNFLKVTKLLEAFFRRNEKT